MSILVGKDTKVVVQGITGSAGGFHAKQMIAYGTRVLAGAMVTHVLITGPEKRAALERAQGLDPMQAPIRAFLGNATVHWAE